MVFDMEVGRDLNHHEVVSTSLLSAPLSVSQDLCIRFCLGVQIRDTVSSVVL